LSDRTCSVEGCEDPHLALGFCRKHYARVRRNGTPDLPYPEPVPGIRRRCSVEGCELPTRYSTRSITVCSKHYQRLQKHGTTDLPPKRIRICGRPDCERPAGSSGFCLKHWQFKTQMRGYGITADQYKVMLEVQDGGCAICGGMNSNGRRLAVDHDHSCCPTKFRSCGKCVRGLLCSGCNATLGHMRDNPALLRAAVDYLERTRSSLAVAAVQR